MWTNLCAAYDALSPPLRELCDGLTALHDALPHGKPELMSVHPVVRVHPDTGKRALYVNEHFTRRIVELSAPESDALLGFLTRWVQQPRFTVRYRWSEGTIGIWDNRCTQHFVVADFVGERIIQRVTVMGDRPKGNDPRWPAWKPTLRSAQTRHDGSCCGGTRRARRERTDPRVANQAPDTREPPSDQRGPPPAAVARHAFEPTFEAWPHLDPSALPHEVSGP
jgi:hypothetical protein